MILTSKLMIVAGEASGDGHAAKLVRALQEISPGIKLEFFGAAGPKMREAGVEAVVNSDNMSIVGLAEIGRTLPMFLRAYGDLKQAAQTRKPDAVILVDFPDFNLRLAKALKRKGFPIIYYISPQLWAWRQHRISSIKRYVDLLITILPFEKDWYADRGVTHVEYVGSPLAREIKVSLDRKAFCSEFSLDPDKPIVALLPGSRHKEIVRILPVMVRSAVVAASGLPDIQFLIAAADENGSLDIRHVLDDMGGRGEQVPDVLRVIESRTYDLLGASDAAAVTSGTATLEAGIIGTPLVVVYRTSRLNYRLCEPMIAVPHYGLINLIAGRRVAVELIQDDFTPEALATELLRLIETKANTQIRQELRLAAAKLGEGGASNRAAQAVMATVERLKH